MRALTAAEILQLWEWGQDQDFPVERSLTLLAVACPDVPRDQLALLSLGQRDAWLLTVREKTFGSILKCYAECPGCGEGLEFSFAANDIGPTSELDPIGRQPEHQISVEGYDITFRVPTSADLMDFTADMQLETMRDCLLQRCIISVKRDGETVDRESLGASVITALTEQIAKRDPQAETLLDICCPACGQCWQALFDISEWFWVEITDQAKRLLREVHALAGAYCWREQDILAMSARRRRWYLEMLGT
jgi:hypothetical protein